MPRGFRKTAFWVIGVDPKGKMHLEVYRTVPAFRAWVKTYQPQPTHGKKAPESLMHRLSDGREVLILHGKEVMFTSAVEAVIHK